MKKWKKEKLKFRKKKTKSEFERFKEETIFDEKDDISEIFKDFSSKRYIIISRMFKMYYSREITFLI